MALPKDITSIRTNLKPVEFHMVLQEIKAKRYEVIKTALFAGSRAGAIKLNINSQCYNISEYFEVITEITKYKDARERLRALR